MYLIDYAELLEVEAQLLLMEGNSSSNDEDDDDDEYTTSINFVHHYGDGPSSTT